LLAAKWCHRSDRCATLGGVQANDPLATVRGDDRPYDGTCMTNNTPGLTVDQSVSPASRALVAVGWIGLVAGCGAILLVSLYQDAYARSFDNSGCSDQQILLWRVFPLPVALAVGAMLYLLCDVLLTRHPATTEARRQLAGIWPATLAVWIAAVATLLAFASHQPGVCS